MSKKNFAGGFASLLESSKNESLEPAGQTGKETLKEVRATFIVDVEQRDKIKYMAYMERTSIKEQVNKAFEMLIKRYEKKNGKIKEK